MNSAIEAPARASRAARAAKPAAVPQAAADARAQHASAWSSVVDEIEAAMLLIGDDVPTATNLLIDAKVVAEDVWKNLVGGDDLFSPATLTADDSRGSIAVCDIEARVLGAHDMRGTSALARTTLASVLGRLCQFGGETWQLLEVRQPAAQAGRNLGERRAGWIFSNIAGLAESIGVLTVDVVQEGAEEWERTVLKVLAAEQLAAQIGALADIGMRDVGLEILRRHDDGRGWMLPPSYHSEADKTDGAA